MSITINHVTRPATVFQFEQIVQRKDKEMLIHSNIIWWRMFIISDALVSYAAQILVMNQMMRHILRICKMDW